MLQVFLYFTTILSGRRGEFLKRIFTTSLHPWGRSPILEAVEKSYWLNRWNRHETGWHQTEVEPALIAGFSQLPHTRVFVHFSGKSLDLKWLLSRGHEVVAVELSPLAVNEFFSENNISYHQSTEGDFEVFRGDRITIYNGDFFRLKSDQLGKIGALYDRAALIALPADMRARYAVHMTELIQSCSEVDSFYFLQVALEKSPPVLSGPPFSVSGQEIQALYGNHFEIGLLSSEKVDEASEITKIESVYSLKAKV
jgi:thiopurine S-methyltransferase